MMAVFQIETNCTFQGDLKLAGFAGSRVEISFNLRGGISTQEPKIIIFIGS